MQDGHGTQADAADRLADWRGLLAGAAFLATAALLVASCSVAGERGVRASRRPVVPAVRLTISPAAAGHARPNRGVTVEASHGKIQSVTVTAGHGRVSGVFNATRTAWHTTWALRPSRRYTVTATGVGILGKTVTRTTSFRTLTPRRTFQAQLLNGHRTYGVGMPIMLRFSRPVTRKAAVERSLQLWTSKPVYGAWYWDGNQNLMFRPRTYWPQHTEVRFLGHLAGVEAARGIFGTANLSQSFRIGNSLIAVVNTASHHARIFYRDRLFGVWPVSTGRPGDDTANGTYLTIEKGNPVLMSGPGYTNFPVPYSVRFTWSGNYMHDAYWSVAEQGYVNVSHGCVNMSPQHARIYYRLAVPGDPVTVTNSPVAGAWDDGWTEWFLSWRQLLRGSATHQAVQAGPQGSSFVNPATVPPVTARAPLYTARRHNSHAR